MGVALAIAAWKWVPRPWHPAVTLESPHYFVRSSATKQQTEEMAQAAEQLYVAYSNRLGTLTNLSRTHPRLAMKLYKDREEFRRINPGLGWGEAFYRRPACNAYYSASEANSCHWMLHEATHQLNDLVAKVDAEKWLDEGLSEYFSTSRIIRGRLIPGTVDPGTYPVWWIDDIATTPNLATNIQNGSVIPLRSIITGRGGPWMNTHVNLYYLHWWTLAHFVFESDKHRARAPELLQRGGDLKSFEELIGPVDQVQVEWHAHVRRLKAAVGGSDLKFLKTGELPKAPAP